MNGGEKYPIHSEHLVYNYININVTYFSLRAIAKQSLIKHSTSHQSPPPNHRANECKSFQQLKTFFLSTLAFLPIIIKNIYSLKFAACKNGFDFHFANAQRIVLYRNMKSFDYLLLILELSIIRYRYLRHYFFFVFRFCIKQMEVYHGPGESRRDEFLMGKVVAKFIFDKSKIGDNVYVMCQKSCFSLFLYDMFVQKE